MSSDPAQDQGILAFQLVGKCLKTAEIIISQSFDQLLIGDELKKTIGSLLNDFTSLSFIFGFCIKTLIKENPVEYLLKSLNCSNQILLDQKRSNPYMQLLQTRFAVSKESKGPNQKWENAVKTKLTSNFEIYLTEEQISKLSANLRLEGVIKSCFENPDRAKYLQHSKGSIWKIDRILTRQDCLDLISQKLDQAKSRFDQTECKILNLESALPRNYVKRLAEGIRWFGPFSKPPGGRSSEKIIFHTVTNRGEFIGVMLEFSFNSQRIYLNYMDGNSDMPFAYNQFSSLTDKSQKNVSQGNSDSGKKNS